MDAVKVFLIEQIQQRREIWHEREGNRNAIRRAYYEISVIMNRQFNTRRFNGKKLNLHVNLICK